MADSKIIAKRPARFGNARFGASRFGFVTPDMDNKEAGEVGQFPYYKHRDANPVEADEPEHEEVN